MVRTVTNKHRAVSEANNLRRRKAAATLAAILDAQTAVEHAATYLIKEPTYDSILTGAA